MKSVAGLEEPNSRRAAGFTPAAMHHNAWRMAAGVNPAARSRFRLAFRQRGSLELLLRLRDAGELVGAERRRGQAVAVVEVADRMVRPAVADRDRLGDLRAADHDLVPLNDCLRGLEFAILAADREADELDVTLVGVDSSA